MGSSREYWCPYCDKDASDHSRWGPHCKEERLYGVWSSLRRPQDLPAGRHVAQFLPRLKELIKNVPAEPSSYLENGTVDTSLSKIKTWASRGEDMTELDTYDLERLSKELRQALRNRDRRTTLVTTIINNLPYRGLNGTLEMLGEY